MDKRVTTNGRCPICNRWLSYFCERCRDIDHGAYIERLEEEVERLRAFVERCAREDFRGNAPWTLTEAQRLLAHGGGSGK